MSIRILSDIIERRHVLHRVENDIESFAWVAIYAILVNQEKKARLRPGFDTSRLKVYRVLFGRSTYTTTRSEKVVACALSHTILKMIPKSDVPLRHLVKNLLLLVFYNNVLHRAYRPLPGVLLTTEPIDVTYEELIFRIEESLKLVA